MKEFIELLRAFEPLIVTLMPVIMLFAGWWVNMHSNKVASKQTEELKAHSDENRDKIQGTVTSTSGSFKRPDGLQG